MVSIFGRLFGRWLNMVGWFFGFLLVVIRLCGLW